MRDVIGDKYRSIPNIFCTQSHWEVASSMIEPHRNKISEKDTSENIMHKYSYDTVLIEDVHLNEKHQ